VAHVLVSRRGSPLCSGTKRSPDIFFLRAQHGAGQTERRTTAMLSKDYSGTPPRSEYRPPCSVWK
jgi:hypothetical protein